MKKDYYEILDVDRNATQDEIKKAFRKLARKHHPDVGGSEEKFKEINEAFQVLSDPEKKSQYDQFGSDAFSSHNFSGFNQDFTDIFKNFGDMFNMFSENETKNYDLKYEMKITLEDSFNGTTKEIEVPVFVDCDKCNATGSSDGSVKNCHECGGTGEKRKIQNSFLGQVVNIIYCNTCSGSGQKIENPCNSCKGLGELKKQKKIKIEIPKGIENGSYLKVSGNDSFKGNLYVLIKIKPHEIFERNENDLFCKTTISIGQAIFGSVVEIPTIKSHAKLKIPSGTQSHKIFRLKGQGMPYLHSNRKGDQFIKVVVKIPEKLNEQQKKLLKEIFRDEKIETTKGFFEKIKEYMS